MKKGGFTTPLWFSRGPQQGSVLVYALLMLLIFTLLGVASMQDTVLEERMAYNHRQTLQAFQAAQAGLAAGEEWLDARKADAVTGLSAEAFLPIFNGTGGLYAGKGYDYAIPDPDATALSDTFDFSDAAAWTSGNSRAHSLTIGAANPRYIIEYVGIEGDTPESHIGGGYRDPSYLVKPHVFRITAIGWGDSLNARYVLQSHYVVSLM